MSTDDLRTTARLVAARERDRVRATLVSGFALDPLYRWLYPDDASRPTRLQEVFDLVLDAAFKRNAVWALDDLAAVAVWTAAGVELLDEALVERYGALLTRQVGQDRAGHAMQGMALCAQHVPSTPCDVLHSIAVAADQQGRGAGTRLLSALLVSSDQRGASAYLESSSARNVPFYRRLGFVPTATVLVPGDGPTMTPMLRAA